MKCPDEMSLEELWNLFPTCLSKPNPEWAGWAIQEMAYLYEKLNPFVLHIHHIGSTAINGIWAKPIIDLLIETACLRNFKELRRRIAEAGYICMNMSERRMDFNKGYTPKGFDKRVFHLHLRLSGDNDEIFFRDYLNSHSEIAKEYEVLKLSLWKRFEHDRDGYTNAKSDFVNYYTAIAKQLK